MLYACGDKQSYSVINTKFSFPDRRFAHNGILSHSFSLGFELSEKLTAVHYIYGIKYIEGFLFCLACALAETVVCKGRRWICYSGIRSEKLLWRRKVLCETGKGVVTGGCGCGSGCCFGGLLWTGGFMRESWKKITESVESRVWVLCRTRRGARLSLRSWFSESLYQYSFGMRFLLLSMAESAWFAKRTLYLICSILRLFLMAVIWLFGVWRWWGDGFSSALWNEIIEVRVVSMAARFERRHDLTWRWVLKQWLFVRLHWL